MSKADKYTIDAATRARKAKVMIAAVLNNNSLSQDAIRQLEHAYRLVGDVTDTLLRNDDDARSEVLNINSVSQVLPVTGTEVKDEIKAWRNNPANV